jgi:hypothetical protein
LDFSHLDTKIFIQSHRSRQRSFSNLMPAWEDATQHLLSERAAAEAILQHKQNNVTQQDLCRPHFSDAFDSLAYPPTNLPTLSSSYPLTASTFDRTFSIVVNDLAPYVRSIVSHELRLETQRIRLSNLLSEGGQGGRNKRPRTTRASRVALEGGTRENKRREHWFDNELNRALVMATAGATWTGLGSLGEEGTADGSEGGAESLMSTHESESTYVAGESLPDIQG